jgi:galactose mutarotase-like enzyme
MSPELDPLESVVLSDAAAKSTLVLAPGRGGMATRWTIDERPIFYLDEATLRDPSKNVRGGNPVLFPSPGKLTGDAWSRGGKSGSMKQHGFARNLPWSIGPRTDASVVLRLAATDATRAQFPWEFSAEYTYLLQGRALRITQRFENHGPSPMPFGAGFHPYFHVPERDKARASITTRAAKAFDNVTKTVVALPPTGIDLAVSEADLHLLDHGANPCALVAPGLTVELAGSPELSHWVVWTLAGKDFVCVEPWTCPGDALNTGERVLELPPGATRTIETIFTVR